MDKWRTVVRVAVVAAGLAVVSAAYANLLVPDGGGTGDPEIEKKGREAASMFFAGVAWTYDMLGKVEAGNFDGAKKGLGEAMGKFETTMGSCNSLKGVIAGHQKAKGNITARAPVLRQLRGSYVAAEMVPAEETERLKQALGFAVEGRMEELVGLCEGAASRMNGALAEYSKALGRQGGPRVVESWKLMNRVEQELILLRYGAILVEGPVDAK